MLNPKLIKDPDGQKAEIKANNGKVYHVKVIPFRSQTNLLILDPETENGFFDQSKAHGASALLDKVLAVTGGNYDWDTPAYRQVCSELELDPDAGRPTFKEADKALVTELEQHIDWQGRGNDYMRLNQLIFDLTDLLRTDQFSEFHTYVSTKQTLENWTFSLPKAPFKDAFDRVDRNRINSSKPVFTSIDFLPSWGGHGCNASIYLWGGSSCESDGWDPQLYGHVDGVALTPAHLDMAMETVVRRLKEQSVFFLSTNEAQDYLNHEGAYWAFHHGSSRCPAGFQPRTPSVSEKLRWRIKRPETPFYDQYLKRSQT